MPIYALDGIAPELPADGDYFVAETAVLIGRVRLKPGANVWFGAVLRGDNEWIEVGAGSNVQDGAVLHTDLGAPLVIGPNVTIGHLALVHGCTIGQGALIGMGAAVLNHATIGEYCLVGAHALVPEGRSFEPRQLIVGAPAKAIRPIDEKGMARLEEAAVNYQEKAVRYRRALTRIA
jgi:carbonic anhydrase/acetyltransferase-like protein (isoleucine patch superfamily)